MWFFGASARKDEMFREIVDRRDASTIEKVRERDDDDVSLSVFSISIFTDRYFYL